VPGAGEAVDAGLVERLPLHCPAANVTVRLRDLVPGAAAARLRSRAFDCHPAHQALFRRGLGRTGQTTLGELVTFLKRFPLRLAPAAGSEFRDSRRGPPFFFSRRRTLAELWSSSGLVHPDHRQRSDRRATGRQI
jgi:hypothetical protein